jgi:hypothetical protein
MSTGESKALAAAVDRSGFPFQLAVESELRSIGGALDWDLVATEVPAGDSYADIVLRRPGFLAVIECKRVDGGTWHFLVPKGASSNVVDCRLEWHNPRARYREALMAGLPPSMIFAADCTMCEGSYESSVSILPKTSASHNLEVLCRELLAQSHALGDSWGVDYGSEVTYLIPVLVTNAALSICEYDPTSLDLEKGVLGEARFAKADFVRFMKALVIDRSNDYDHRDLSLQAWTADRERTVFVVSPSGLRRFLSGFRAFGLRSGRDLPEEYSNPPRL